MGNSNPGLKFLTPVLALTLLASSVHVRGQFGPLVDPAYTPQAKSQEEFDGYLEILMQTDPKETIAQVEKFVSAYPTSQLLGIAYQHQMLACQELNDLHGVVEAGAKALKLLPDNLTTLLTLASSIPNTPASGSDAAKLLRQAEEYAHRALRALHRIQVPREISLDRWERLRDQMEAQAHEALGHVAAKQGRINSAISEFEKATENNPEPQGTQFLRLGLAYLWAGRQESAKRALKKAAELGPDLVTRRALEELQKLGRPK